MPQSRGTSHIDTTKQRYQNVHTQTSIIIIWRFVSKMIIIQRKYIGRIEISLKIIQHVSISKKIEWTRSFCCNIDVRDTIKYQLANNKPLVDRLLSDITYQSADNLVDGLTKAEEEGYTYEHYYGNKKYQHYGTDYQ